MVVALTPLRTAHAARWFRALADPTRLEIVAILSQGERCVCELEAALDAAQSRLSFHLRVLKDAGLVADRRQGRWVYYALAAGTLDQVADFAHRLKPARRPGRPTVCCD